MGIKGLVVSVIRYCRGGSVQRYKYHAGLLVGITKRKQSKQKMSVAFATFLDGFAGTSKLQSS